MSRLAFSFLLLLGTMVSVIMILPGMEEQLKKVRREGGSTFDPPPRQRCWAHMSGLSREHGP